LKNDKWTINQSITSSEEIAEIEKLIICLQVENEQVACKYNILEEQYYQLLERSNCKEEVVEEKLGINDDRV